MARTVGSDWTLHLPGCAVKIPAQTAQAMLRGCFEGTSIVLASVSHAGQVHHGLTLHAGVAYSEDRHVRPILSHLPGLIYSHDQYQAAIDLPTIDTHRGPPPHTHLAASPDLPEASLASDGNMDSPAAIPSSRLRSRAKLEPDSNSLYDGSDTGDDAASPAAIPNLAALPVREDVPRDMGSMTAPFEPDRGYPKALVARQIFQGKSASTGQATHSDYLPLRVRDYRDRAFSDNPYIVHDRRSDGNSNEWPAGSGNMQPPLRRIPARPELR